MFSYGCWKSEALKDFHLNRGINEQHKWCCLPAKHILRCVKRNTTDLRIFNLASMKWLPVVFQHYSCLFLFDGFEHLPWKTQILGRMELSLTRVMILSSSRWDLLSLPSWKVSFRLELDPFSVFFSIVLTWILKVKIWECHFVARFGINSNQKDCFVF